MYLKGIELICNSSCSQTFDEWFFLYYKRTIAVMNSFKFTMSLQNMSFSKEISSLLLMIPTWVKKKLLLSPEMQVMKQLFTRAAANYFF